MGAQIVVLVSAEAEWRAVRRIYPKASTGRTLYGETLSVAVEAKTRTEDILLMHGGWGKIAAAASTQYAIDTWRPGLLINLGTCGGIAGQAATDDLILADSTLVYDIIEQMGDPEEAVAAYTTRIDTAWVGNALPDRVRRGQLLSADKDIICGEVSKMRDAYDALAADWESGAIAWVAARNGVPVLILRGVTDIVSDEAGEAYGDVEVFNERTGQVMERLCGQLPFWLDRWHRYRDAV